MTGANRVKSARLIALACASLAAVGVSAVGLAIAVGAGFVPQTAAEAAHRPRVTAVSDGAVVAELPPTSITIEQKLGSMPERSALSGALVTALPKKKAAPKPAVAKKVRKRAARPSYVTRRRGNVSRGGGWRTTRASWYGPGFYGNTMAGGGRLTRNSMVVAHKSLPFGTKVQVSYGGRTVSAVVQDRGPYIRGREFDLGPGVAKALDFSGVGNVSVKVGGN